MKWGGWLILALVAATPAAAWAQVDDGETASPQSLKELIALIECRTGGPKAYNDLMMELTGEFRSEARRRLHIKPTGADNPFLAQYEVGKKITLFGRQTDRIAFTGGGVFGVFDAADPRPMAQELGAKPTVDTKDYFVGEKELRDDEQTLKDSGVTLHSRVTLTVSTAPNLPGKILAGCGYRIEPE